MLFDGHPRLFMHNVSYSLSMLLIVLIQFHYIYKVLVPNLKGTMYHFSEIFEKESANFYTSLLVLIPQIL